jgi:ribose 5-phosphate isomerase A
MEDTRKARAAEEAVRDVVSGQVLGLGSGSTAALAVAKLGERARRGELRDIIGVPTSEATRAIAERYGIPIASIDAYAVIDLTIDGADEVGPGLDLIKGLGGALLREKAVERKSKRFVVIVDDTKLVERLGTKAPVPIEVAPASWR